MWRAEFTKAIDERSEFHFIAVAPLTNREYTVKIHFNRRQTSTRAKQCALVAKKKEEKKCGEQSKNRWSTHQFRYIDLLTGRFIVSIFSIAYFNWHSRSASREPSTHRNNIAFSIVRGSTPIAEKQSNRSASLWEKY